MLKYNNRKIKAKIHLVSKVGPSKPVEEKERAKRRKKRKKNVEEESKNQVCCCLRTMGIGFLGFWYGD